VELTRRAVLRGAALTAGAVFRAQRARVAIAAQAVSAVTVRILFLPPTVPGRADASISPIPDDGALVRRQWPHQPTTRGAPRPGPSHGLRLNVSDDLIVSVAAGGRMVQQLRADVTTNTLTFLLGRGPLLGLGEGGPQFDRRGTADEMRNGQDGYRLHTHGARVPVQWIVGTEGWGLYVHQPLGTLDLTGSEGRFAASTLLPLDVFVVVSNDPAVLLREYAVITGYAELPARWTFGYMQSHRTLAGPDEVLGVARTFREKGCPAMR
jgi:alpha-glucosidase/alpha-D-xyloside xylohydrolase